MLYFRKHQNADHSCDHPSVNRKSAFSQIKNIEQIIFIHIPREDYIIKSCPDNSRNDADNPHIKIIFRILTCPFRFTGSNPKTKQNCRSDNDSVIRYLYSE